MALRMEPAECTQDALVLAWPGEAARRRARRARMFARRRRSAGVLVALAAVAGLWASAPDAGRQEGNAGVRSDVILRPGQTLWDLAARYASPGMDRRAYVDAIERVNGVGGLLQAGTRVRLPEPRRLAE